MKHFWLLLAPFIVSAYALGDKGHDHSVTNTPSEFKIDKDLLNEIYSAEITEVSIETRYRTGAVEVLPSLTLASPGDFTLTNNYFTAHYGGNTYPLFHLAVATPIFTTKFVESYLQGRVGYGYREGNQKVTSGTGLELMDGIKLHWLPLLASTRIALRIPKFSYVKPYVTFGAGAQWLNQDGQLDGIDQSFWIPYVAYGGGLTLFDESASSGSWFGGAFIGISANNSFGAHSLRYQTIDLAISFVL